MRLRLRDRLERWLEALWEGRAPVAFSVLAVPLSLFAAVTWGASRWRRTRPRRPAGSSVVSVGNLRVGGTGKTQVVAELCRRAEAKGLSPAVITRGWGGWERGPARAEGVDVERFGDEALLLACRLRGTAVIVARERSAGVDLARSLGRNWIVLDDGLQQRSIEPTRQVVVVPAESPWGNGRLLPLGPLREPRSVLTERDLIWVHGDAEARDLPASVRSRSRPTGLVPALDLAAAPQSVGGRRVAAFAGIARPERFFASLAQAGAEIVARWSLADHRRFQLRELAEAARRAGAAGATALVCTEKDAVRLPAAAEGGLPIFALRIELDIRAGEDAVAALLT